MKTLLLLFLIFISTNSLFAQKNFRLTDSSLRFDVSVTINSCQNKTPWECDGKFDFFRKKVKQPFQTITMRTQDWVSTDPQVISFEDFNFDGAEDVAISDGMNSAYITPSYRLYLFSKQQGKFVYSPAFTKLATGDSMGLFKIDKKKRTLIRESRIGCCYFWTETYDVAFGKPRKISVVTDDESSADQTWSITTTKKLINGRWRTWTKRNKIQKDS